MTIRVKALFLIGLTVAGLIMIVMFSVGFILLPSFTRIERNDTRLNVERVLRILAAEHENLRTLVHDWSAWDDTYKFVQDKNLEYLKSNIQDSTFKDIKINLLLILDQAGKTVYGRGYDAKTKKQVPVPPGLTKYMTGKKGLSRPTDLRRGIQGLVMLARGPMLVASLPIVTSRDKGPIKGALIMGRYLANKLVARLGNLAQVKVKAFRLGRGKPSAEVKSVVSLIGRGRGYYIRTQSDQIIAGYALLRDLKGKPAVLFRVQAPRIYWRQGRRTVTYLVVFMLASGLAVCLLTLLFLNIILVSRVSDLSRRVGQIGHGGDPSARVEVEGHDELSGLAGDINAMLDALETFRQKQIEAETRYSQLVRYAPVAIFELDLESRRLTSVNDVLGRYTGHEKEELLDMDAAELFAGQSRQVFINWHQKAAAEDKVHESIELKFKNPGGQGRWAELNINLVHEKGRPVRARVVAVDITDRRAVEQERIEYQRQLRSMAAELALSEERERRRIAADLHDRIGRNLFEAKLKLKSLDGLPPGPSQSKRLHEVGEVIDLTIRDTRTLTGELGTPILYDLGLEAAVEWLAERIENEHGLNVAIIDDKHQKPLSDEIKSVLFRAVGELTHNVVKHARASKIEISLEKRDGRIEIKVIDDGVGFEAGQTGPGSFAGDGLGLMNIRERLDYFGGTFKIESQPGQGVTVTLTAPLDTIDTAYGDRP